MANKKSNPAGIGMPEAEMTALSKRIADIIAGKIMEAVVEKFKDVKSGDILIPFGGLYGDADCAEDAEATEVADAPAATETLEEIPVNAVDAEDEIAGE